MKRNLEYKKDSTKKIKYNENNDIQIDSYGWTKTSNLQATYYNETSSQNPPINTSNPFPLVQSASGSLVLGCHQLIEKDNSEGVDKSTSEMSIQTFNTQIFVDIFNHIDKFIKKLEEDFRVLPNLFESIHEKTLSLQKEIQEIGKNHNHPAIIDYLTFLRFESIKTEVSEKEEQQIKRLAKEYIDTRYIQTKKLKDITRNASSSLNKNHCIDEKLITNLKTFKIKQEELEKETQLIQKLYSITKELSETGELVQYLNQTIKEMLKFIKKNEYFRPRRNKFYTEFDYSIGNDLVTLSMIKNYIHIEVNIHRGCILNTFIFSLLKKVLTQNIKSIFKSLSYQEVKDIISKYKELDCEIPNIFQDMKAHMELSIGINIKQNQMTIKENDKFELLSIHVNPIRESHQSIRESHQSIRESHQSIRESHQSIRESHQKLKEFSLDFFSLMQKDVHQFDDFEKKCFQELKKCTKPKLFFTIKEYQKKFIDLSETIINQSEFLFQEYIFDDSIPFQQNKKQLLERSEIVLKAHTNLIKIFTEEFKKDTLQDMSNNILINDGDIKTLNNCFKKSEREKLKQSSLWNFLFLTPNILIETNYDLKKILDNIQLISSIFYTSQIQTNVEQIEKLKIEIQNSDTIENLNKCKIFLEELQDYAKLFYFPIFELLSYIGALNPLVMFDIEMISDIMALVPNKHVGEQEQNSQYSLNPAPQSLLKINSAQGCDNQYQSNSK